jgi:hypothetical protein
MKMQRTLTVFLCAAAGALTLAIVKALLVSGLDRLPPVKLMVYAASMFGLLAALVDWGLIRNLRRNGILAPERRDDEQVGGTSMPPPVPGTDPAIEQARFRPIVFREICPPSSAKGLSFYGGAPVGPSSLVWPRDKATDVPLSFLMQWDCAELARQDVTGLLPRDGVLYLFADLNWSDFRFVHAPGSTAGWSALDVPQALPALYGNGGAYHVPYCSPLIPLEDQDVPKLLPKWPFAAIAFSLPVPPDDEDGAAKFWNEGESVGETLLRLQHPAGVPAAKHLNKQQSPFTRPFPAFPHDYSAVRIVMSRVLQQLQRPGNRLLRDVSDQEREAQIQLWRDEAKRRYVTAAEHRPAARVEQSLSDDLWRWLEGLEPVLRTGWGSLIEESVNASLGLGSEAAGTIPASLVSICAERHQLASAYLHEEYPDRGKPEALAAWEKRKAAGLLKEVRALHAPCPNHMFGPPSFVQGYVEEHLDHSLLLLELSTRQSIGQEFGEGVLQFMIGPTDLRERRFDKTILVASAY